MSRQGKHSDGSDEDYDGSDGPEYSGANAQPTRKRTWRAGFQQDEQQELPAFTLSSRPVAGQGGVFKTAAIEVLTQEKRLMATGEVTRIALERKLLVCQGKTPDATMASALYTDVRKKGGSSPFIKPKQGLFGLRVWLSEPWLLDWLSKEGIDTADFLPEEGGGGNNGGNAAANGRAGGGPGIGNGRKVSKKAGGGRGNRSGGGGGSSRVGGNDVGVQGIAVQGARSNAQRAPRVNYKPAFSDDDGDDDEKRYSADVQYSGAGDAGDDDYDRERRAVTASQAAARYNSHATAAPRHSHAAVTNGHNAQSANGNGRRGAEFEQQRFEGAGGRAGSAAGAGGGYSIVQQYMNSNGRMSGLNGAAAGAGYEPMQQYAKSRPAGAGSGYGSMQQYVQQGQQQQGQQQQGQQQQGQQHHGQQLHQQQGQQQQQQQHMQQGLVDHAGLAGRSHQANHAWHDATNQALKAAEAASASVLTSMGLQQQQQQQHQQQLLPLLPLQHRGSGGLLAGQMMAPASSAGMMSNGPAKGIYGSYSNGMAAYGSGGIGALGGISMSMGMPGSTAGLASSVHSSPYTASMQQHNALYGSLGIQNMALAVLAASAQHRGAANAAAAAAVANGRYGGGSDGEGLVDPAGLSGVGSAAVGGHAGAGYGLNGGLGGMVGSGGGMMAGNGPMRTGQVYYQQYGQ